MAFPGFWCALGRGASWVCGSLPEHESGHRHLLPGSIDHPSFDVYGGDDVQFSFPSCAFGHHSRGPSFVSHDDPSYALRNCGDLPTSRIEDRRALSGGAATGEQ